MALLKTLIRNKKIFSAYNQFRKDLFRHFSPQESDVILSLLPWLICVNHPDFPGYLPDLKHPFRIFGIDHDAEIKNREASFKKQFNCLDSGPILKPAANYCKIEGIYTIGSTGTISQTSYSDCDLWVCIDHNNYTARQAAKLHEKISLLQAWLDATLKMAVHFFISDINDIQKGHFGCVEGESCGSTQSNVLKEEFYRTTIVVSGKTPFWCVCYNSEEPQTYKESLAEYNRADFPHDDCVDLGSLETIEQDEYFGAALWQFNKALTRPLKSIIKMILLAVQLQSPREKLFCHRFRDLIMSKGRRRQTFIDPSMFTLDAILGYFEKQEYVHLDFLKQCFYLRYEINILTDKITLKKEMSSPLFNKYKLDTECLRDLNQFDSWPFHKQQEFCTKVLDLLLEIYKDIASIAPHVSGRVTPQDMTIIGRKLSSCLARKENKVPIVLKPFANFNVPDLLFRFEGKKWCVAPSRNQDAIVVRNHDIVFCAAYLVWNDLFSAEN
ncbi:MAG: class I adenylate cyclase, partial [Syntrophobacterales bacterium]|nr:class I adenylate cyclase [Syntrophobacterales bacterium]